MAQTKHDSPVPPKFDPDAMDMNYIADALWGDTRSTDNLFSCPFETFCSDYCTSSVREEVVEGCIKYLSSGANSTDQTPILDNISNGYEWNHRLLLTIDESEPIEKRPAKRPKLTGSPKAKDSKRSPVDRYAPLFAIIRAIYSYGSGLTEFPANPYTIKQYPHELAEDHYHDYGIAQGCVAEAEWDSELECNMARATPGKSRGDGNYTTDDGRNYCAPTGRVVVPITCCHLSLRKVREVLSLTAQHIFQNDPRRMWMYAMSVDGHEAFLWLFTRTHIVAVEPIDWVKNINGFVRLVLTLALSSPRELGLDPLVHRVAGSQDYIYEVDENSITLAASKEDDTPSPVAFYRTVEHIMKPGLFCLTFKTTRILKVIRVHSLEDPSPILEGQYAIIKDIWIDKDIPTEVENQERMFAAVDAFIANPDWKSDRRLKDFDTKMLERLEDLFVEKKYRSLFLNVLHAWRGIKASALSDNVDCVIHHNAWGEKLRHPPIPETLYVPKQQARFIYAEVCTPLTCLETLGEVMDIIGQTITALQVFFCAGWVHRDISAGNIMAYRTSTEDLWVVKLTDFEFAKAFSDAERLPTGLRTGTAIGTASFMPHEIYARGYEYTHLQRYRCEGLPEHEDWNSLAVQLRATGKAAEALLNFDKIDAFDKSYWGPISDVTSLIPSDADFTQVLDVEHPSTMMVVHNYQHDLESLWWVTLWFLTCRVRHEPSLQFAQQVFFNGSRLSALRANVFRWGGKDGRRNRQDQWPFHPDLQGPFVDVITKLRKAMVKDTFLRPIMGQLMLPSSYSAIHALFATQFEELNKMNEEPWAKMHIR